MRPPVWPATLDARTRAALDFLFMEWTAKRLTGETALPFHEWLKGRVA